MRFSHDTLNARRERDFQSRILKALEKPPQKRSRMLVVINSPLFLWCLTAVVVTLGGGYYSTYKQCVADAKQTLSDFGRFGGEIEQREDALLIAIANASSMAEVRQAAVAPPAPYFSDLKDMTRLELNLRHRTASRRIDRSTLGYSAFRAFQDSDGYKKFALIFSSSFVNPSFTDVDLPLLKKTSEDFQLVKIANLMSDLQTGYAADCSFWNVALIASGEEPVIVRAINFGSFSQAYRRRLPRDIRRVPAPIASQSLPSEAR